MLSRGAIGRSQPGQCEGGRTTDSPLGTRQMTTLRNEPITSPTTALAAAAAASTRATLAAAGPRQRSARLALVVDVDVVGDGRQGCGVDAPHRQREVVQREPVVDRHVAA